MKTTILIFLFILAFSQSNSEKEIELTPIVLPYDSLNIDEVYGYGATIIARSGNTIYHSTDDGGSWDIALESDTKLNQLYSKDPHTVFAIGDSGLVYRTMDYGASWIDESVKTDLDIVTMAAKDPFNYLLLTERNYSFYKKDLDSNYIPIGNNSNIPIYSAVYQDSAYFFGGGYSYELAYTFLGDDVMEYEMPCFVFNGEKLSTYKVDGEESALRNIMQDRIKKRLKLFNSDFGIIHTAWHYEANRSGLNLNGNIFMNMNMHQEGVILSGGHLIYADVTDSLVNMVTSEGYWITRDANKMNKLYYVDEFKKLLPKMETINHVTKRNSNSYLLGAANSTIYKTNSVQIPIPINIDSSLSVFHNIVEFKSGVELINISNYLGQKLPSTNIANNTYKIHEGLNFITYIDKEKNIRTIKVVVE